MVDLEFWVEAVKDNSLLGGILLGGLMLWALFRYIFHTRSRVLVELEILAKLHEVAAIPGAGSRHLNPEVVLDAAEMWFKASYGWLHGMPVLAFMGAVAWFVLALGLLILAVVAALAGSGLGLGVAMVLAAAFVFCLMQSLRMIRQARVFQSTDLSDLREKLGHTLAHGMERIATAPREAHAAADTDQD